MIGSLRGRPVVQYHQQWEYLARWLGLEIVGTIENRPGISPSPRHVENLIRTGRERAPVLVLAAPWDHVDAARRVAEEVGGALIPVVGVFLQEFRDDGGEPGWCVSSWWKPAS